MKSNNFKLVIVFIFSLVFFSSCFFTQTYEFMDRGHIVEIKYTTTNSKTLSENEIKINGYISTNYTNGEGLILIDKNAAYDGFFDPFGGDSFYNAKSLESVSIPGDAGELDGFIGCTNLNKLIIEDGYTSLVVRCSFWDSKIEEVYLGRGLHVRSNLNFNNVRTLRAGAYETVDLEDEAVYFKGNVETLDLELYIYPVDFSRFDDWTSLKVLTLPDDLQEIGDAFSGCGNLTTVYCDSNVPPIFGNPFKDSTKLTHIYVPRESVDDYKRVWSRYADKIYGHLFEE